MNKKLIKIFEDTITSTTSRICYYNTNTGNTEVEYLVRKECIVSKIKNLEEKIQEAVGIENYELAQHLKLKLDKLTSNK